MNKTITLAALCLSASAVKVETGDVLSDIADWFDNDFVDFWEEDFVDFWEEDFAGAFEDFGDWIDDAWNNYIDWFSDSIVDSDIAQKCKSSRGNRIRQYLPDQLMTSTE